MCVAIANLPCFLARLLLVGCPYDVLAERTVGSIDCLILMNTSLCDANTNRGNDLQSMHHLIVLHVYIYLAWLAETDLSLHRFFGVTRKELPEAGYFQLAAAANHLSVPSSGRSHTSLAETKGYSYEMAMVTALTLIAIPLAYYTGELVSGPTTVGS